MEEEQEAVFEKLNMKKNGLQVHDITHAAAAEVVALLKIFAVP